MAPHSGTLGWKIPWMEEPGIYGNIYVSLLLSQFVPPSPVPTVPISLFSMSESLPALQIGSSVPFL